MKRDDWMLLSLTFLTGAAIGAYVYVMAWKPAYEAEELGRAETEAADWSLTAHRRGGEARSVQPSFRLLGDGSYRYVPGGQGSEALEPREGRISSSLLLRLRSYDEELLDYAAGAPSAGCPSDSGGYDFEYRFVEDSATYLLDTCFTALGTDTPLALALQEAWAEVEGAGGPQSYDGLSDWLQAWLRRNIGVNP